MDSFKLKIKTMQVEFDFEVVKPDKEDKEFINEIVRMIDRKSATMVEKMGREELKEKYKEAAEGYKYLANGIDGMHHGVDEYIAQAVEKELEEKKEEKKEEKIENESVEEELTEKEFRISEEIKEKLSTFTFHNHEETDDPSIRLNGSNETLYQTYYVCPKCKNKGKRYIPKQAIYTNCHNCYHQMRIKPASHKGFPEKDKFGNIFVAGSFKPEETQLVEA